MFICEAEGLIAWRRAKGLRRLVWVRGVAFVRGVGAREAYLFFLFLTILAAVWRA